MKNLQDFSHRLDQAQSRNRPDDPEQNDRDNPRSSPATGIAMRLGVEMVVGVCIALFIGWGLDSWLGTSPWFLLLFIPLGMAAGIMNVVRAAKTMQTPPENS